MIPNNVLNMLGRFIPNMNELQKVNTPDDLAQLLLNSGKVNQQQVNQVKEMWKNPQVQKMINSRFYYQK